jgi:hypothetical protein
MIRLVINLTQGGESWPARPLRRERDMGSVPFVCILSKTNILMLSPITTFFGNTSTGFFKIIPNFFRRVFKTVTT